MNENQTHTSSSDRDDAVVRRDTWVTRLRESRFGAAGAIVIVGVLLTVVILLTSGRGGGEGAEGEAAGALSYPRGPHGARLLSDTGGLQVEMTIYETGVPPRFRIYPYDGDLKPIRPGEVSLRVELHRLGGRIDTITFFPESDYLQGNQVVEEPHSFDVKVFAQTNGKQYRWEYAQIEGKVTLTEAQLKSAGIEIETAGPRLMTTSLELPGEIGPDETRLAHVVPRVAGVMTAVLKTEGDFVRRGEVIAVLDSRELATAKSAFLAAQHHAEFTRAALAREEELWKKKISAEREYLNAKKDFDEAELAERLARQSLLALGVSAESIGGLAGSPGANMAQYEIRAPLDGRIIERQVTVGEAVTAETDIFTIADLSQVWVEVSVSARDLGVVREGQEATIQSTDLDMVVKGRVSYVGPLVGEQTRAATARIVIPNPQGRWRPGLFVKVRVVHQAATVPVVVRAEAIQTFRDWQVVFFRYGNQFEARPLELGRSDGQWVEVLSGLKPGDRYAATNAFAVKAEIGKLGATHDH
jgi:membrane fusion protein, heavy metal efflux system